MRLMRLGQKIGNRLPQKMIEGITRKNMGGMDVQLSNMVGNEGPLGATMGRSILKGAPVSGSGTP